MLSMSEKVWRSRTRTEVSVVHECAYKHTQSAERENSKLQQSTGSRGVSERAFWELFFSEGVDMLKSRELIEPRRR